jgi:hypothetical protein
MPPNGRGWAFGQVLAFAAGTRVTDTRRYAVRHDTLRDDSSEGDRTRAAATPWRGQTVSAILESLSDSPWDA